MPKTAVEVVQAFVAAINAADPARLRTLMSEDHTFTDALGTSFSGATKMQLGWKHFFNAYPGYQITVNRTFAEGDVVALFGEASGGWRIDDAVLPDRWAVSAAWLAEVEKGQIKRWTVFCDTTWVHPPANHPQQMASRTSVRKPSQSDPH
jgi:ketosteroid isomerase-like protein